jgi:hypothetical protein
LITTFLTIEGVEGIGRPVTIISPADVPMSILAFIERLRGGASEFDDEMLLITVSTPKKRRQRRARARERVRQALPLLCQHASEEGVSADGLAGLLDDAKKNLR